MNKWVIIIKKEFIVKKDKYSYTLKNQIVLHLITIFAGITGIIFTLAYVPLFALIFDSLSVVVAIIAVLKAERKKA